jgi:hypothetical protein
MNSILETSTNNLKDEENLFKSLAGIDRDEKLNEILESTFNDFNKLQTTENIQEQITENIQEQTTENIQEQTIQIQQIKEQVEDFMQKTFGNVLQKMTNKEETNDKTFQQNDFQNIINCMNKINPEEKEEIRNNLLKQMPDITNLMSNLLKNMNNEDDLTDFVLNTETESYDETDTEIEEPENNNKEDDLTDFISDTESYDLTDDEIEEEIKEETKEDENNSNLFMNGINKLFNLMKSNNKIETLETQTQETQTQETETEETLTQEIEETEEIEEIYKENNEKMQTINKMMSSITNLLNMNNKEDL